MPFPFLPRRPLSHPLLFYFSFIHLHIDATQECKRASLISFLATHSHRRATMHRIISWTVMLAAAVAVEIAAALDTAPIAFHGGYSPLFGGGNLVRSPDGRTVKLKLDRYTGSGFVSKSAYHHGFFSASIKLPDDYTAGVVVAFYLSNNHVFEKNHDELDLEFLGNRKGHEWRLQTNIYGNGSTTRGREERYLFPFDPTQEPHRYSILWTANTIIFYVDDTPIREVVRDEAMGGDFPSKPMSVYATIWDGSAWATEGGKYKVNYKYSPFTSEFSDFVLRGCPVRDAGHVPSVEECAAAEVDLMMADCAIMTPQKRAAMRSFRDQYMTYTVCHDRVRYNSTFPECDITESDREKFQIWGESKRVKARRRYKLRNKAAGGESTKVMYAN